MLSIDILYPLFVFSHHGHSRAAHCPHEQTEELKSETICSMLSIGLIHIRQVVYIV